MAKYTLNYKITCPDPVAQLRLRVYSERSRVAISSYMSKIAHEAETYMKSSHPWRNRTGNAEAGLHAKLQSGSKAGWVQEIELSHGVYYGVYLEFSMGRRFAIIEPTMRIFGARMSSEIGSILG